MSNITRWNPFREMASMQQALNHMFEDGWSGADEGVMGSNLALDVHEDDKAYTVTTALPGVNAEHINVRIQHDILTIEGEIPEHKVETDGKQSERCYGHFSRSVRLPQPIDRDQVEAAYDNGVLTLTLPKSPDAQPKQIIVKSNKQLGNGTQKK